MILLLGYPAAGQGITDGMQILPVVQTVILYHWPARLLLPTVSVVHARAFLCANMKPSRLGTEYMCQQLASFVYNRITH
jgi:hypothetical protein